MAGKPCKRLVEERGAVGSLLYQARIDGELKQDQILDGLVSRGMTLSKNLLSLWERASRPPAAKHLPTIAEVYQIPLEDLRNAYVIDKTLKALKKALAEIGPAPEAQETAAE